MNAFNQKWKKLSEPDQQYIEQLMDQLIGLKNFSISDEEIAENLNILERMKAEPDKESKNVFEAIHDIRTKLGSVSR